MRARTLWGAGLHPKRSAWGGYSGSPPLPASPLHQRRQTISFIDISIEAFCMAESTKHASCWGIAGVEPMPSGPIRPGHRFHLEQTWLRVWWAPPTKESVWGDRAHLSASSLHERICPGSPPTRTNRQNPFRAPLAALPSDLAPLPMPTHDRWSKSINHIEPASVVKYFIWRNVRLRN